MTDSPAHGAIEAAFLAHGWYDLELLGEVDFYLVVAKDFAQLHDLVFRRAREESTTRPDSPEARFWLTLRAGLAEIGTEAGL